MQAERVSKIAGGKSGHHAGYVVGEELAPEFRSICRFQQNRNLA